MAATLGWACGAQLASYRCGSGSTSDIGLAVWLVSCHSDVRLHLGTPLCNVKEDLKRSCRLMKECHSTQMWRIQTIRLQYVLNLLGQSDDPLVLTVAAMDKENYLKWSCIHGGDQLVLCFLYVYQFTLLLSFEERDALEIGMQDAMYAQGKGSCYYGVIFLTTQVVMGALALYGQAKNVKD
jgi:hypothetical protein